MLSAATIVGYMTHGIGRTPDSRHSLYASLNRAGRALMTEHAWSWRTVENVLIPAVADQAWIDLPSDFGDLLEVTQSGIGGNVCLTTLADLQRMREISTGSGVLGGTVWYVAFGGSYGSADGLPNGRERVGIYPTPTTDAEPTICLTYRKRWRDISENDTTAKPNVPDDFEGVLILRARAEAKALENDEVVPPELARYADEIERLKRHDAGKQTYLGVAVGGSERFEHFPDGYFAGGIVTPGNPATTFAG